VDYAYDDPSVRPTAWGQFAARAEGPGPVNIAGPSQCRGFGTRTFTVARKADGLEVIAMTGSQRKGIRINRIDTSNVW
jgi:hypothetical protein